MLVDSFGRRHSYLRISVTDRCNFRCVYCMPNEEMDWLPREGILTFEEIDRVAGIFLRLGVNKIRLTGGEPTIRQGLLGLVERLGVQCAEHGARLLMTTNGLTLERDATAYRQAGIRGLNISLDTLRPERFAKVTGRDRFDQVWRGVEAALAAGFDSLKLNAVVMRGVNDDEILDFVELTRDLPLEVRFIEVMPFPGSGWLPQTLVPYSEMLSTIRSVYRIEPRELSPNAVAKEFSVAGHVGTIGFITSMTEDFCGGCDRVRLTAEGSIKPCLFGNEEVPLLPAMRSGADDCELEALIRKALFIKQWGHAPLNLLPMVENRSMVRIGG